MRISTPLAASFGLLLITASAQAANVAMPLGIELGSTSCSEIKESKRSDWRLENPGISAWSKGTILSSSNPHIEGLERARKLMVICDSDDRAIYISLTIPKDSVQNIAAGLDKKYKSSQRNLPSLGRGYAKWSASNAHIIIEYEHVSFDAYLIYETGKSEKLFNAYSKEQERQKKNAMNDKL